NQSINSTRRHCCGLSQESILAMYCPIVRVQVLATFRNLRQHNVSQTQLALRIAVGNFCSESTVNVIRIHAKHGVLHLPIEYHLCNQQGTLCAACIDWKNIRYFSERVKD